MDKESKTQADMFFAEFDMSRLTVFHIFVCQSLCEGGFPFCIILNQPNKKSIAAILEV